MKMGTHKRGTATATGMSYKQRSGSGVRHGPNHKNVSGSKRKDVGGSGLTGPIKGRDKGGL